MTKSEVNLKSILALIPGKIHIRIHGCFRLTVMPDWKRNLQNNEDQHILFVKSGIGKYYFNDGEEILESGKLVYVSSGCRHQAWHDIENPLVITGFRFGFYDHASGKSVAIPCEPFHISILEKDIEFYEKLSLSANDNYYFVDKHTSRIHCSTIIVFMLSVILNRHETNWKSLSISDGRIERVHRFIMDDINAQASIKELAAKVGMSSRHLQSCFKEKYGITPKQYQLKVRMNHARFLLETTDLSINKIAISLGYSDQFVFSRQFKSIYGISPSGMRKTNKKENAISSL